MRKQLLLGILALLTISIVGAVPHAVYPEFSRQPLPYHEGLYLYDNEFSYIDDVVYKTAYYSIDGGDWQEFTLEGSRYRLSRNWLRGEVRYSLPDEMWSKGEHYIITFSCTEKDDGTWDCHGPDERPNGQWRLIMMNYTEDYTSDCGDVLDYQCGIRTICDKEKDYGTCQDGYECNDENLCIARDDLSCEGVTCAEDEYCSRGVCLLNVTGNTYFSAVWGDDNNSGNYTHPFKTWHQAVKTLQPGDIAYFRGGVWQPETHVIRDSGYETMALAMEIRPSAQGASGTPENPIKYYNYPGEKPIMDGKLVGPKGSWNGGISISDVQHIHFKGLTIRHVHQAPPRFEYEAKPYTEAYGIGVFDAANFHFENMVVHDIDGRGYSYWSGGSSEPGEEDFPYRSDTTSWINCDVYNVYDRYDNTPGNAADGWLVHGNYPNYFTFDGCRAWNFSDDGFDVHGQSYRHFKDCWSMPTTKYERRNDFWGVEGNGYKLPGISPSQSASYELGGEPFVIVENCIAANGEGAGTINNLQVNHEGNNQNNGIYRNNLVYKTDRGFTEGGSNLGAPYRTTNYTNNIAYASHSCASGARYCYEVAIYRPDIYPNANNTWLPTERGSEDGWPGWKTNPKFNVTDEDFISLDYWELTRPRKADGSLPDVDFGHLAPGSDLIDGGTIIEGYHCATNGSHPGDDCREWYGLAPDLGPFEYRG